MTTVDVIFLAYTKNKEYHKMLLNALYTLRHSEADYIFDVKIVESNKNYLSEGFDYPDCRVIVPDENFNYNKYLNYALEYCKADWVVVCNNDLLFTGKWFSNIMQQHKMYPYVKSFTPYEPFWHVQRGFNIDHYSLFIGDRVGFELGGWCLVINREIIENCNLFDPAFAFIFQDNDYRETIKQAGYVHALAAHSTVYHLRFQSHGLIANESRNEMFDQQKELFRKKWPDAAI